MACGSAKQRPAVLRRRGCSEECLRRIAARLCRLDDHGQSSSIEQAADVADDVGVSTCSGRDGGDCCTKPEDDCCDKVTVAQETDTCCGTSGKIQTANSGSTCCKPTAAKETDQAIGKPTSCCTDNTCTDNIPSGDTPPSIASDEVKCATACCASSAVPAANVASPTCRTEPANLSKDKLTTEVTECVDACCESVEIFDPQTEPNACSTHLRAAFDRFEALILQSKCICRSVVRQLGVSCCTLSADGSVAVKKVPLSMSGTSRASREGSGCSSDSEYCDAPAKNCCGPKQEPGCQSKSKESRFCASEKIDTTRLEKTGCCATPGVGDNGKSACGGGRKSSTSREASQDTCCNTAVDEVNTPGTATTQEASSDIERDAAREHIKLSVSGMTCTGCSNKMTNVLSQIPGVHKPEVTFVSGSATFELDNTTSIEETLPLIEKRTGFKCARVVEGYQHLDVYMSPEHAEQFERYASGGLVAVTKAKGTYRITYDPQTVGARDLLPPEAKLAPPSADASLTEGRRRLITMAWFTAVAAAFTIPVVVLNWAPNPVPRQTRDGVSLALATVVQAIAVPEFYVGAIKSLVFSKVIEMDMLVVISITAAYVYSVVAFGLTEVGIPLEQHAFFETSTLLITLVLLGRLIAAYARMRAVGAVSMRSLQAEETFLVVNDGDTKVIDARLLHFGDVIEIRPHTRIVTDATVTSGASAVDESMLTGETVPVSKTKGDVVIAGTLNGQGILQARITRLPGANSLDDIAGSVKNALSAKPRIQDLADKVASWFVPVVVVIAVIVFAIWIAIALKVRGATAGGAVGTAITYAIAVLAVSCPCALGLAVPMVLVIAGGVAAREGVVIKAADATERGYKVTDVVFDKTGTLTTGDLSVVKEEKLGSQFDADESLRIANALVKDDSHPVARAVALHLTGRSLQSLELKDVSSVPGAGMQGKWNANTVKVGNPFWLGLENNVTVAAYLSEGLTCLCLTVDDLPVLAFGLRGTIRPEAAAVTSALRKQGITSHIVSGDHAKAVEGIASAVNIDLTNTVSRHSPTQKCEYVRNLQDQGKIVLFCGDGTNDAVALAQANVGVQVGKASDVVGAISDVVLLGGLEGLLSLLDISKRAFNRVIFNFVWSAVYNVFAILLAAGAFVKFRISPAYAGLGEIVSVGPVILAALTLLLRGSKE